MVRVLTMIAEDCGFFDDRSGQTKDYKIGICCLSASHTTIKSDIKVWLA
jgi:hypothetical protein